MLELPLLDGLLQCEIVVAVEGEYSSCFDTDLYFLIVGCLHSVSSQWWILERLRC